MGNQNDNQYLGQETVSKNIEITIYKEKYANILFRDIIK